MFVRYNEGVYGVKLEYVFLIVLIGECGGGIGQLLKYD